MATFVITYYRVEVSTIVRVIKNVLWVNLFVSIVCYKNIYRISSSIFIILLCPESLQLKVVCQSFQPLSFKDTPSASTHSLETRAASRSVASQISGARKSFFSISRIQVAQYLKIQYFKTLRLSCPSSSEMRSPGLPRLLLRFVSLPPLRSCSSSVFRMSRFCAVVPISPLARP